MKILYIADGRSPTALSWITYFIRAGHAVHLVSTYPCAPLAGTASQYIIPLALSNLYAQTEPGGRRRAEFLRKLLPVRMRTMIRQIAVPLSFSQAITRLQGIIERVQPDLIHAMRIPYEGMLATETLERLSNPGASMRQYPLVISVWGNDFTLHAQSTKAMEQSTRQVLQTCAALHTDCQRDQRLARQFGFETSKPRLVLPGGGGIQLDIFYPRQDEELDDGGMTVIQPRGFRAYVQNDTFFQAIPSVTDKYPQAKFICPGMQGEGQAEGWVAELGIASNVELLPAQSRTEMAELFRRAQISLSITTHDGTPNTLLEAMACGCFPIAGDLESIREWITPGENGMLVDPGNVEGLGRAIMKAIEQPGLRKRAKEKNLELVKERAEYSRCMQEAEKFYHQLVGQ